MTTPLSTEQIAEFQKMFDLFVADCDVPDSIERSSFIKLVRALGMNPTEKEATAMLAEGQKGGTVDEKYLRFGDFCKIMEKWYKTVDEVKADLRKAFKGFDVQGDGRITKTNLRKVLLDIGQEAMTNEEVEDIINNVATYNKDDMCHYEDLILKLQGDL